MEYILYTYLTISFIFGVSMLIQLYQLFMYNKALPLSVKTYKAKCDIQEVLEELDDKLHGEYNYLFYALLWVLCVILSIFKGLIWIIKPVHNLRGLLELMFWEFKEI